ncbi:ATP/GTP-binding protein [Parabacteroides faecis]|uniref:AAA family ATPase n=1 Tax=Parabacteroides faecis TaxID=1217282 RepID=UPI0021645365|nr:ATP/GTP-binding protein [Parabacteroides faecis]MCS2893162.1 ATP/GTP-binding protein [Parabacteroides faecis]UVQ48228.1 ATP/GTP-binding protein [Parabacteroides faecis]
MVFNEVEINNFRGIKHLLLPDLRQINLLVGKNNCGKSTVLDAIFLLSGFSNPVLNMRINQFRDYSSFTEEDIALNFYKMQTSNHIYIRGNINGKTIRELKISPVVSQSKIVLSKDDISGVALSNKETNIGSGLTMNFSYISSNGDKLDDSATITLRTSKRGKNEVEIKLPKEYEETLSTAYISSKYAFNIAVEQLTRIIEEKQDKVIVEILQHIEPRIKSITVLKSQINVDIGLDRLIPINMLGDGIRKLLAIVTALYACKDGAVFIDEIDNGLHFSSLSSLWKAIIKTAELLNVQVFATTHNIESLQSLNNVLFEDEYADSQNDIMCYSLRHMPTDELNAYKYPYEKFQYVINQEIEIR